MENELDVQESENTVEEQTTLESEATEEVDSELTKAQELAKNQRIRAEKAEKELKRLKAEKSEVKESSPKLDSTSIADLRALQNVHDEDVERVQKFATAEGITIAEAVKSDDLQAILRHREELRKSADAANTGGSKRSVTKLSDESIVEMAMKSPDKVDPAEFAAAQLRLRRKEAGLE